MSDASVRGEQSTSEEIEGLTDLIALATSGSGQFIRKTSATTFENATPSGDGTTTAAQALTTTGGSQVIALSNTPSIIILVEVNGQILTEAASDYSISGANVTLLNENTPVGLFGRIVYAY